MEFQQEQNILIQCKNGNLEEFAKLYDVYLDKIYKFVYFKTSHRETAEDITSDVFIKAMKAVQTFKEKKGTFQAWLFMIARNTVIDYYRKKKNLVNVNDVWSLGKESSVLSDIDTEQKIDKLKNAMKNLSSEQREILVLRIWQDMPYKEIAQIVGKSEPAVKMMFSRTVKKLKQDLPLLLFIVLIIKNL